MAGNLQLTRQLLFSGDLPTPKGEVGAEDFISDIQARAAAGDWANGVIMGNVRTALVREAAEWMRMYIHMEVPRNQKNTVKTEWLIFLPAFRTKWKVYERQVAMNLGDLSRQKKGETTKKFIARITKASASIDFVKTEVDDDPRPNVYNAEFMALVATAGNADAQAAVYAHLAEIMAAAELRGREFGINFTQEIIAKKRIHDGLSNDKLKEEAFRNLGREVTWPEFTTRLDLLEEQIKANGNGKQV